MIHVEHLLLPSDLKCKNIKTWENTAPCEGKQLHQWVTPCLLGACAHSIVTRLFIIVLACNNHAHFCPLSVAVKIVTLISMKNTTFSTF